MNVFLFPRPRLTCPTLHRITTHALARSSATGCGRVRSPAWSGPPPRARSLGISRLLGRVALDRTRRIRSPDRAPRFPTRLGCLAARSRDRRSCRWGRRAGDGVGDDAGLRRGGGAGRPPTGRPRAQLPGGARAARPQRGERRLRRGVSDPRSSSYREFVSAAEFRRRFSWRRAEIGEVARWLRSRGMRVGRPTQNGVLLPVSGTAAEFERAFGAAARVPTAPTGRR